MTMFVLIVAVFFYGVGNNPHGASMAFASADTCHAARDYIKAEMAKDTKVKAVQAECLVVEIPDNRNLT